MIRTVRTRIVICLCVAFVCFMLLGCGGVYKALGLTEEQAAAQTAQDQEKTTEGLDQGRNVLWTIISTGIAGVGAVTTALLGKWLTTERKMNEALIVGVEKSTEGNVKKSITVQSLQRNVAVPLAARVRKLT